MALPIVHATAGYVIHRLAARDEARRGVAQAGWARAFAFMALANLPDTDFVAGFLLGRPGVFHRGLTHTVLAALVVGAVLAMPTCWRGRERWWRAAAVLAAVYGSHLLIDALTVDERGAAGAQFFWPLSSEYYLFPFTLFGEIIIDGRSRSGFIASIVQWPTVVLLAHEMVVALAALVALSVFETRGFSARPRARLVEADVTLDRHRQGNHELSALEAALAPESGEEDWA